MSANMTVVNKENFHVLVLPNGKSAATWDGTIDADYADTHKIAMAWTGDKPWHGKGERMPLVRRTDDGLSVPTTMRDLMIAGCGIDRWDIATTASGMLSDSFKTLTADATVTDENGEMFTLPAGTNIISDNGWVPTQSGVFANRRYNDGTVAHVHKWSGRSDSYVPVSPHKIATLVDAFIAEMNDNDAIDGKAEPSSAGLLGAHGEAIYACIKLPRLTFVTANGVTESVDTFLTVTDGYAGTVGLSVYVTHVRVVCSNTQSYASAIADRFMVGNGTETVGTADIANDDAGNFAARIRHSAGVEDGLDLTFERLTKALNGRTAYIEAARELSAIDVSDADMARAISATHAVIPTKADDALKAKRTSQRGDALMEAWGDSKHDAGSTAWSALNTFTQFSTYNSAATGKATKNGGTHRLGLTDDVPFRHLENMTTVGMCEILDMGYEIIQPENVGQACTVLVDA